MARTNRIEMCRHGPDLKLKLHGARRARAREGRRSSTLAETPRVGIVVPVVQRFDLFSLLSLAQMSRIAELEEARGELDEPLGVDGAHLAHVLLGGEDELVVDDPVGLTLEEGAGGVDVGWSLFDDGFVPLLRVFFL